MADVNTEGASLVKNKEEGKGFVFGQNMESRVLKNSEDPVDQHNGANKETAPEPPRPAGIHATSTWSAQKTSVTVTNTSNAGRFCTGDRGFIPRPFTGASGGVLAPSKLAPNPFAAKPPISSAVSSSSHYYSDSDSGSEDRREKPILAPPHLKVSSTIQKLDDNKSSNSVKDILKPSALSACTASFGTGENGKAKTTTTSSFALKPATLQSPLRKEATSTTENSEANEPTEKSNETGETSEVAAKASESTASLVSSTTDASTQKGFDSSQERNYFAAFLKKDEGSESKSSSGFVFGQNMEERVTNAVSPSSSSGSTTFVFGQNLSERVTNSTAAASEDATNDEKDKDSDKTSPAKTLEESAKEYEARQAKQEYKEVDTITGEEDESNVLQVNCRLFLFNKNTQNWLEKGRGLLRLNDMSESDTQDFQSRLVMRTSGTLCVILNMKIWPGMSVDRASQKSIRFSSLEPDGVKVYLIMASPKDAEQIFSAIDWRVQQLKAREDAQKASEEERKEAPAAEAEATAPSAEKRRVESPENVVPLKKTRVLEGSGETGTRRDVSNEESNDSSTVDPETEASESVSSSPVIRSSPSE